MNAYVLEKLRDRLSEARVKAHISTSRTGKSYQVKDFERGGDKKAKNPAAIQKPQKNTLADTKQMDSAKKKISVVLGLRAKAFADRLAKMTKGSNKQVK